MQGRLKQPMNWIFWEEAVVLILVVLAVPALVYALEKVTRRKFNNKLVILLLYLLIFLEYLELSDRMRKGQLDEPLWLPKSLIEAINSTNPMNSTNH